VYHLKGNVKIVPSAYSIVDTSIYRVPDSQPAGDRSHTTNGRLPLFSARPAITLQATQHNCYLADTKLYCLATEANDDVKDQKSNRNH